MNETPLAVDEDDFPVAYPALSMCFHLEPLEPDDQERLARANQLIIAAIETELRHVWASFLSGAEPYRSTFLDFVPWQSTRLEPPPAGDNPIVARVWQFTRGDFHVFASGGVHPRAVSPTTYRFWSEIPSAELEGPLKALSMLQVTMPESTPLEAFERLALEVASSLRIRWGNAGFGYATRNFDEIVYEREAIFTHSRRYHGYDSGLHVRHMEDFHKQIRTANWLTFVGPAFRERLDFSEQDPSVTTAAAADALVLRAGPHPLRLDVNRLENSAPYRAVDRMIQPVRARELDFGYPWSESPTRDWLNRLAKKRG